MGSSHDSLEELLKTGTKTEHQSLVESEKHLETLANTHVELLQEIKDLKATVTKLESDIEDIKFFTPEPRTILDKETIGTIGGLILGALVIIGIFF